MQDLLIIFLSALPVGELRVSIPLALQTYHFSIARALFDAYIGGALPVLPLLFGLNKLVIWCDAHSNTCHRFLERFFSRTQSHLKGHYEKYGAIALGLWVALTVPPTGVWSASVAAVLFRIRPKVAIPAILLGLIVNGLVIVAVTKGIVTGVNLL